MADSDLRCRNSINELKCLVDELALGEEVIKLLLPLRVPHHVETEMWDYKEKVPILLETHSDDQLKQYQAECGETIKDVMAFYNAYGGYILFGIANNGQDRICGCESPFDWGNFNRQIYGYTGASIECLYRIVPLPDLTNARSLGLLLVPRRPPNTPPVGFRKDGPEKANGNKTFRKGIYLRVHDECRPAANTSEDWKLLHSERTPPDRAPTISKPKMEASNYLAESARF